MALMGSKVSGSEKNKCGHLQEVYFFKGRMDDNNITKQAH